MLNVERATVQGLQDKWKSFLKLQEIQTLGYDKQDVDGNADKKENMGKKKNTIFNMWLLWGL